MKITRDNYEIYFMDYLDGNLSTEDIRELKAFLIINRDIEETLDETDFTRLVPKEEHFRHKDSLKKEAYHECPDYYPIAASENELTANDRKALGRRIDTPVFQAQVATYARLRLKPEPEIHFEKKKALCRKSNWHIVAYRTGGIAAALALLFGLVSLFPRKSDVLETPMKKETPAMAVQIVPPIQAETQIVPEKAKEIRVKNAASGLARPPKNPAEEKGETVRENLPPLPVPPPQTARLASHLAEKKYNLKTQKFSTPEIYLNVYATQWKQSGEEGLFSETIVVKAIETGKKWTEKIKERIALSSNKMTDEPVIAENIANNRTIQP